MAETEVILKADTVSRIADAIRAGREDADVTYLPSEMPDTIRSIRDMENALLARTVTEYVNSSAELVGMRAFMNCAELVRVSLPACKEVGMRVFESCTSLADVDIPAATFINDYAFKDCTALRNIVLPVLDRTGIYVFTNCTALEEADLHKAFRISYSMFSGCTALSRLILRRTSGATVLDGSTNGFVNTPIGKGTGHIYVPAALVETYKGANNWKNFAAQFRVLEDYTVDGTTTGALDINKTEVMGNGD